LVLAVDAEDALTREMKVAARAELLLRERTGVRVEMAAEALYQAGILPGRKAFTWQEGEGEASGKEPLFFWPTEYRQVTQAFGVNAEYYSKFGLPGHEGIDIVAPLGSKIFACLDGKVISRADQHKDKKGHAYGNHVRILHVIEGVEHHTIYAHLSEVMVETGQLIGKGEVIGLAGSTGNSTGPHLHLSVKRKGATKDKLTEFPYDLVDPTQFLELK
jgi:murein DD-endopeptidase MepM/ murein hydrolase activator NlpD